MPRRPVLFRSLAVVVAVLFVLAGCGTGAAEAPIDPAAVVIDVRTPAEYAEGHLAGALNIDLQSGSFEQQILELEPDGAYVLYCRSGNRSAQAAQLMEQAGFANVTDAGSLASAAEATGLEVVTG